MSTYDDDICALDHYVTYQLSLLSIENADHLERHAKGQNVELPNTPRYLIERVHELHNHLLNEDILWVSDMTLPRHRIHASTNRVLKPQYSHMNNGNRKCAWVQTILGGTPGLFTNSL